MDKTDIILCQLLLETLNFHRELAEKLNLFVTAVHNPHPNLNRNGHNSHLHHPNKHLCKKAIPLLIFGISETTSINNIKQKIEKRKRLNFLVP